MSVETTQARYPGPDRLGPVVVGDRFEHGSNLGLEWTVSRVDAGGVYTLWAGGACKIATRAELVTGPWRRWRGPAPVVTDSNDYFYYLTEATS